MRQFKRIKRVLTLALSVVLALTLALPLTAGEARAASAAKPLTFTMSGPTDGRINSGGYVTFRAKGGTSGTYWLRMDVDSLDTVTYEMPGGVLTLSTGNMKSIERGRDLPFGVHFKIHVLRVDNFNNIWEESEVQTLDVVYPTSDQYSLKAKGAEWIYAENPYGQFSLAGPPTLYKNGVEYLDPEELGAVYRFSIRTEKDQVEVSKDGMIRDVGVYDVDVREYFEDPDTGKVIGVSADTVKAKIIPPVINVNPGILDGGKFTVSSVYDGKEHGIDNSQISVGTMPKDAYSISYRYIDEASNTWKESATAPSYVEPGTYPVYITAAFPTSRLLKASALANIVICEKAATAKSAVKTTEEATKSEAKIIPKTPAQPAANTTKTLDKSSSKTPDKPAANTTKTPDKSAPKTTKTTTKSAAKTTAKAKTKTKVGKVTGLKLKKTGKKIKVTFKKVSKAKGYQILYGTKSSLKGAKKISSSKTNVTLKGLKSKKTCYVKVRAYKTDASGKKVYGSYSKPVKIKL